MRASIAVVHLAWAPLAEELPLFAASYTARASGCEHDLIVALRGFRDRQLEAALASVQHLGARPHQLPDDGFDIDAYFAVAQAYPYDHYVFLNSYSRIRADRWLGILADGISPSLGAIGATGSWESTAASALVAARRSSPVSIRGLRERGHAARMLAYFPSPPNPHLRTTCFLISRTALLALEPQRFPTKMDTWRFESGRHSMTRQLARRGLGVAVRGGDGRHHPPAGWPGSGTFRSGEQEHLLVADNRTAEYEVADPSRRAYLRELAFPAAHLDDSVPTS